MFTFCEKILQKFLHLRKLQQFHFVPLFAPHTVYKNIIIFSFCIKLVKFDIKDFFEFTVLLFFVIFTLYLFVSRNQQYKKIFILGVKTGNLSVVLNMFHGTNTLPP